MTDPEPTQLSVHFAEGDEGEEIIAVFLASNMYRIEETPLLFETDLELYWGDTVELELLGNGQYRFIRIIERTFNHHSWILPNTFLNSPQLDEFLAAVMAAGGNWEQVFEGMLFVHIPHNSDFDAGAELDRRLKSVPPA